jgi:hypothetical protein
MSGFEITQPLTRDELERAQGLLNDAGFENWVVSGVRGAGGDPSLYRAERVLGGSGPRQEKYHASPETLVELVREVEARLPSSKPIAVSDGMADSTNY